MKQLARGLFVVVAVVGMSCTDDGPQYTDADPGPDTTAVDANASGPDAELDETPPVTTITDAPADPTNETIASFAFEANEEATFECRVDDAAFAACASGFEATVADGAHTFDVRATDEAGNVETAPPTHAWTVDTDPPETTITMGPPALDNSVDVDFTFTSDETGSFECRIDGGAFATCASPHGVDGLADGAHTFEVRAVDLADNADGSPASHPWTLDSSTPDTVIDAGPTAGSFVNVTGATFAFSSPDAGVGATFECRLDAASFAACTSPLVYAALAAGEHTFRVRVLDAVGNPDPSPALRTWTIDVTAPDTTIDSGPTGTVPTAAASFGFSANEPATFECQLDADPYAACTTPRNLTGLAEGGHVFRVRATDLAGNVDASPASRSWTVDTIAPDTTLVGPPPNPSNNTAPSIGFTSDEAAATFECQLDAGGFVACATPRALTGLAQGSHTFAVRAVDAGLTDATPASHTWVVDTMGPTITGITTTTADGRYGTGSVVTIVITFSEAVTVTGSPTLLLETGVTDRSATLTGGSGTTMLTFQYTVQAGDSAPDLDYASTGALTGGTIVDAATNAATRTLPAPGGAGSIAATHAVVIAAAVPVMTSVTVTPTTAYTNTTLSCTAAATDADGDVVTFTYAWLINDVVLGGATASTLTGASFAEGNAVKCRATPSDGGASGTAMTSAAVTILNSTPVMTAVTVTPSTAYTDTLLTCNPSSSDADGESVSHTFTWQRDGVPLGGQTAATLAGSQFSRAHVITCTATPSDGTVSGTAMTSGGVTILNTPPVISGISVTPSPATTTSVLSCAHTPSDADGDAVNRTYAWLRNTLVIAGATGASLDGAAEFGYGDQIQCRITPNDGIVSGATVTSGVLAISNTPPVMTSVTLSPGPVYTNDTVTCTPSASDGDGHGVNYSYEWLLNNGVISGQNGTMLSGTYFSRGQEVRCRVTPNDTIASGGSMTSAPLTISNTPPVMATVTVAPSSAYTFTTLTCGVTAGDADGDGLSYSYAWYVEGGLAGSSASLTGDNFIRGDDVYCVASPFDGTNGGSSMQSGTIVIQNAGPPPVTPTLSETSPGTLTCAHASVSDPDGDTVDYDYIWIRNGAQVPGTLPTLGTAGFNPGDVIECVVETNDGAAFSGGSISNPFTIQPSPSCQAIIGLQCGVPVNHTTIPGQGSTDQVDSYSCSGWSEIGPEVGHYFTAPAQITSVTATLTDLQGVDLDVFVIPDIGQGCASNGCLAAGNDAVNWNVTPGNGYYVVVDGYTNAQGGAQGGYTLTLTCSSS